ncbi:MAG: hypothetical protein R3258_07005 [Acidimicrobiia bacterium]|nr:hypothetical protein [Acidimicrobiia bacterium]
MSLVCEVAAPFVANSAVDGTEIIKPLRGHTDSCLRCQARLAAMSKTARELNAMTDSQARAPADLEWRVMSALEGDLALPRSWKAPVAVAAVLISFVAAVIVWRLKPRTN